MNSTPIPPQKGNTHATSELTESLLVEILCPDFPIPRGKHMQCNDRTLVGVFLVTKPMNDVVDGQISGIHSGKVPFVIGIVPCRRLHQNSAYELSQATSLDLNRHSLPFAQLLYLLGAMQSIMAPATLSQNTTECPNPESIAYKSKCSHSCARTRTRA